MKILLPDIHKGLTKNLCIFLDKLGHQVIIPSNYKISHYPQPPVQQWLFNNSWTQESAQTAFGKNVVVQDKDQILDSKPEVLFISNYESQFEILNELAPNLPNSKIAFYSGNDYWDGFFDHNRYQNYLFSDQTGRAISDKYKLKNAKFLIPFIYPEESKIFKPNTNKIIGCYINDYKRNFPNSYHFYERLKEISLQFDHKLLENQPIENVYSTMQESSLTLHIKEKEGWGMASLESLAFGRPLILHRALTENKTLKIWSHQFLSAFYIENGRDFFELLTAFDQNESLLVGAQRSAYHFVRETITEEESMQTIKEFLNNLV